MFVVGARSSDEMPVVLRVLFVVRLLRIHIPNLYTYIYISLSLSLELAYDVSFHFLIV